MSTVLDGDLLIAERGGVDYQVTVDDVAAYVNQFNGGWKGIYTSNHTVTEAGTYTMDCAGGVRSFGLPAATGSGDEYVLNYINASYVNYGNILFSGGDTVNQVDLNVRFGNDTTVRLIDSAPGKFTTEGVMVVRNLTMYVPTQFATLQEALDATVNFRSLDGTIWIRLPAGNTYLTGNTECALRCRHSQQVIIRGSSGQYPPRYENGANNTFPCVSREVDKDHALTLGGTILHVDSTGNGIRLEAASTVSFRYMQIRDNKNGTPYTTPSNYIIRDSRVQGWRSFDRLLIVGTVYGFNLEGPGYVYMPYVTCLHQTNRAIYASRGVFLSSYRFCSWGVNYGMYFGPGSIGYASRPQFKGDTAVNTGAGRGFFINNAVVNVVYPQIESRSECFYIYNNALLEISFTSNTNPINKVVLKGNKMYYANNSTLSASGGGASTNCDMVPSSSFFSYGTRARMQLGNNVTNSDTPVPAGKQCKIVDGSIAYGGALTGLTPIPAIGVEALLSRWVN